MRAATALFYQKPLLPPELAHGKLTFINRVFNHLFWRSMSKKTVLATLLLLFVSLALPTIWRSVQGNTHTAAKPAFEPLDAPIPFHPPDTVFMEELSWRELRDAIGAGSNRVIVAAGGVEQSGPYLPLGKHNYILRVTTERIARRLGNTLVAPLVNLSPEGEIDPPSGHMLYPGTISLRPDGFKAVIQDLCRSLESAGFREILLLGDSGDSQESLSDLSKRYKGRANVRHVSEYYNYTQLREWLHNKGYQQRQEPIHDDLAFTAQLLAIDPELIRTSSRQAAGLMQINGITLEPLEKYIQLGGEIIDYRVEITVNAINSKLNRKR